MEITASVKRLSVDEYLALERAAETRSEYRDGVMVEMPPSSLAHNQIVTNLICALHPTLRSRDCFIFAVNLRLRVPATGLFTYPDVVVVCSEPEIESEEQDILTNPTLLIEVLSPSTEAYDRGRKFDHYRTVESLQGYALIAQDRPQVEYFARQDDGRWLLTVARGLEAEIELSAMGVSLPLSAVYERVPGLA